jgi:hypothetical protein
MRWENLLSIFGIHSARDRNEAKDIDPRPLTEREKGWIRDILQVNDEWRDADISRTQVVAEGPSYEGFSIRLQAPEPENPNAKPVESVGELLIQTDDGNTITVQLSQYEGRLRELYLLFLDTKHRLGSLPESWAEASREATNI